MRSASNQYSLKLLFFVVTGLCATFSLIGSMHEIHRAERLYRGSLPGAPGWKQQWEAERKERKELSDAQREQRYKDSVRRHKARKFRMQVASVAFEALLSLLVAWLAVRSVARGKAILERAARFRRITSSGAFRSTEMETRRIPAARQFRIGTWGTVLVVCGLSINLSFLETGIEVIKSWNSHIHMPEPGMRGGYWETPEGRRWHEKLVRQWNTSLAEFVLTERSLVARLFRLTCMLGAMFYLPAAYLAAWDVVRWRSRRKRRRILSKDIQSRREAAASSRKS